jgi:hypothetical protein
MTQAIWQVTTAKGEQKPLVADSMADVRKLAGQLGGKNYRCVTKVPEGTPLHKKYCHQLGLL